MLRYIHPRGFRATTFILVMLLLISCGGGGSSASKPSNTPPTIEGSISSVRVGEAINFIPEVRDIDADQLTLSISGQPDWMTFNSETGALSGTPTSADLDSVSSITISVSDGMASDTVAFDLTVIKPIFYLSIQTTNLDQFRDIAIELNSCFMAEADADCVTSDEVVTITQNGLFKVPLGIKANSPFEIKVDRDAGRQDCALQYEEGTIGYSDDVITIDCQPDASAPLFAMDKMHRVRLIISSEEWSRFVLDTERANYTVGDANGIVTEWNTWSHSEVYRQVDFEYLDSNGDLIERLEKVGFKMRGNTSRQWPEYWYDQGDNNWTAKPRRFSFGLKFDEEFDEDEGVYSCIDNAGEPAAVDGHPCNNRVGKDLDEVPDNDGREFMDVEKLFFRFNRDDPSYQRELLAHDILNNIGVPASRVAHANVELQIIGDGDLYGRSLPQTYNMGVFQMVEQVDKPFLKRYFGKNGFLFKVGAQADLAGAEEADTNCIAYEDSAEFINANFCQIGVEKSDPDSREEWLGTDNYLNPTFVNSDINDDGGETSQFRPYKPPYDLKSKKKSIAEGRELLQDFMQFVQTNPSAQMLSERFDVPGFIKAQAAEIAMGAVDHYVRVGNNYYLYLNPITDRWTYMVNDFDFVFRDSHDINNGTPEWFSAFRDIVGTYAFPSPGKVNWSARELGAVNPILWDIVFSEQANIDLLYTEMRSILDNEMNWDIVGPKLTQRNALVQTAIQNTEAGLPDGCGYIYNPDAIDAVSGAALCDAKDISIRIFIENRGVTLYQELQENGF